MVKQESQDRCCSACVPVRSETFSTLKQKHVGQAIVQFPQARHRPATSSQRGCSKFAYSNYLIPPVSIFRPMDAAVC